MGDTFRQERKSIKPNEISASADDVVTLDAVQAFRKHAGMSMPDEVNQNKPIGEPTHPKVQEGVSIQGNPPPALQELLKQRIAETDQNDDVENQTFHQQRPNPFSEPAYKKQEVNHPMSLALNKYTNDPALQELLSGLTTQNYEKVTLPSLGKFYSEPDTPTSGVLHIRPMTGQDEAILSSARHMRGGRGIEMIFRNCLREKNINPEKLLSVDRTYLLIYLRAISYGNMYEVSIKCPECNHNFDHEINLDLQIQYCPDNFSPENLIHKLPVSGYSFAYRLMTGSKETEVTEHRNRMSKFAGSNDDTFLYRASMLIEWMGTDSVKVTNQLAIQSLLERLSAMDVNYIRNVLNEPPFGVITKVPVLCPSCYHEFEVELPYESNFFFPRVKTESPQL